VLIDRHPSDVSMAVKADTESRLFVGGREAVFVFEPNARGGYDKGTLLPFPPDSIIIGLELRGNDLYVLTDNALYLVREGRTRRTGLRAERLLWGLPLDLHVSFHCLAWGPEGDLYLNHGDPLLNFGDFPRRPDHWGHWTLYPRPEGTRVPYTGVGAVLRLRPDGSNLRVVSVGYRGPVGLAFDRHWNLFTNDNDHESLAHLYAPARLMHVTPHTDFAWPRGWMASKSPDRADLLEPMTAALGRGVPCGLAYYDEPYLDKEYRQSLLMGRWDRLTVTRYPLLPKGASFTTEELPFLMGENLARPVGVAVGRGGRVFATVLYLPANVGSPHCFSDLVMITRADDAAGHPFEPYDVTTVAAERLWADLSSSSWERRSNAHQELLRRGGTLLGEATRRLAAVRDDDPALMHLPWLAAASGRAEAAPHIAALARHERPEVRVQAIRIITEFSHLKYPHERLAAALADSAPAVQLAALAAFFDAARPLPLNAVVKLARSDDTYLRHTATRLLARRAALKDIAELARSNDPATRLAGVLAAGTRLTVPSSDFVPPESVKLTYTVANAFFTLRFADADKPVDLRAHARTGSYTTAQWWAAITPAAEQKELFELLVRMLEDPESRVRLQAAYWLSLLCDPRSEKRVAAVREAQALRWSAEAPLRQVAQVWAVGPFADSGQGLQPVRPPEEGVIDLTAEYATSAGKRRWQQETGQKGFFDLGLPAASGASVYLYFRLQSVSAQRAVVSLGTDGAARVWHNGSLIRREIPLRRPRLAAVPLDLQPGSNDVLIRLHSSGERQPFELLYQAEKEVVASLPEKLDSAALAQRLREASRGGGAETVPPEFLAIDWPKEAARGNAVQGRKLFGTRGCARCHAVAADQLGGGAPSLADARRRFTVAHLVESVLLPSKQVAEPFRGTVLNLANGLSLSGLVVSETAETVEVLQADATRKTIRKGEIEERSVSQVSPMPAGLVKAPQELRDLLAYLLSENPLPP
jgi:putative heme-binding domain-containing protein